MSNQHIFKRYLQAYIDARFPAGLSWNDASANEDFIRIISLCLDFGAVTHGGVGRSLDEYASFTHTIMPIAAVLDDIQEAAASDDGDDANGGCISQENLWNQLSLRFPVFGLGTCAALTYCPQFDDLKNTNIATITLQEIAAHHAGHRSGTYQYLAQAHGGEAASRLSVASQFMHNAFAPNAQIPALRPLDVKRKGARQSEVHSMLEQIAGRARVAGAAFHHSPASVDSAIADLIRLTEGFSYFSNAERGKLAAGASYTSDSTDLYGGSALILIGVSGEEIVFLMAEFDQWAE